jgi:hypothetical protein
MKCPHCLVDFHYAPRMGQLAVVAHGPDTGNWQFALQHCPSCQRLVLEICRTGASKPNLTELVFPRSVSRAPLSPAIPEKFADDYAQACLVLVDSPKASAALSRRCLQALLRQKGSVLPSTLEAEIQQVIDNRSLPPSLVDSLDAVRTTGNFARYPMKSKSPGEISEVEIGEAEWNLDTLESLFDYYFVQPAAIKAKRDALDRKLAVNRNPQLRAI